MWPCLNHAWWADACSEPKMAHHSPKACTLPMGCNPASAEFLPQAGWSPECGVRLLVAVDAADCSPAALNRLSSHALVVYSKPETAVRVINASWSSGRAARPSTAGRSGRAVFARNVRYIRPVHNHWPRNCRGGVRRRKLSAFRKPYPSHPCLRSCCVILRTP